MSLFRTLDLEIYQSPFCFQTVSGWVVILLLVPCLLLFMFLCHFPCFMVVPALSFTNRHWSRRNFISCLSFVCFGHSRQTRLSHRFGVQTLLWSHTVIGNLFKAIEYWFLVLVRHLFSLHEVIILIFHFHKGKRPGCFLCSWRRNLTKRYIIRLIRASMKAPGIYVSLFK